MSRSGQITNSLADKKRSFETDLVTETPKKAKKISIDRLLKVIKNGRLEQLERLFEDESYSFNGLFDHEWDLLLEAAADSCRIDQFDMLLKRRPPLQAFSIQVHRQPVERHYACLLTAACLKNDVAFMELALQRGADVYAAGKDGWYCLHIAAKKQNLAAMELLLKYNANINQVDFLSTSDYHRNCTPLRLSCVLGNREVIGFLLERGAAIWVAGQNALAHAAGNPPILEMMLNKYGVDVNIADNLGRTALWQVCHSLEPDYPAKVLLQHGANPNVIARQDAHFRAMLPAEPLLSSICEKISVVKLLLLHGARVDAVDSRGRTALMSACLGKHRNAAKLLLDHGADVNIADNNGSTALMLIVQEQMYACMPMLLARDADVSLTHSAGTWARQYSRFSAKATRQRLGWSVRLLCARPLNRC